MSDFFKQLGQTIRGTREHRGISQARLAEILGVSRPTVISYEKNGKLHILLHCTMVLDLDLQNIYSSWLEMEDSTK